jgi:hypothetical protein
MLRIAVITIASLLATYATWANDFSHIRPERTPHSDWHRCDHHHSHADNELDTPRYSRVIGQVLPSPWTPIIRQCSLLGCTRKQRLMQ